MSETIQIPAPTDPFPAYYPGTCTSCSTPFEAGDIITRAGEKCTDGYLAPCCTSS